MATSQKINARRRPTGLVNAPIFDPNAPPPAAIRDYETARSRSWKISYTGAGMDGAIEAYRKLTVPAHRQMLVQAYERELRFLADPSMSLRPDFHALPQASRPYLLGPYLNTLVGHAYPKLCWETSDPQRGRLTYIFTGGPAEVGQWRQRLPDVCAWLGQAWTIGPVTANTLTLLRRAPLPANLPFAPQFLKRGALFAGVDVETREPLLVPFAEMAAGTFIAGASGTGKSNALHILLKSIFADLRQFSAVYLVDGKDGVAFNRYRNVAPNKVKVIWDEHEFWALTTKLLEVMKQRNVRQREIGVDNATDQFIALVIDEMSAFSAKPSRDSKHPDNKIHARFVDELTMLARRGRSTGLRLFISVQEPVVEQIPASIRANCLSTLAFRLPIDAHANAVFGQLEGLPMDPRKLGRGNALFKNGLTGEIRHVQMPVLP